MAGNRDPIAGSDQPTVYHIRLRGHLDRQWAGWFEGLTVTLQEDGDTLLSGPLLDQAALHGVLKKIRDLGLPLLSVNSLESGWTDPSGAIEN